MEGKRSRKTNIQRGLPKKWVAWTVCQFKGGLVRKRGGVLLRGGVDTAVHTMLFKRSSPNFASKIKQI